MNQLRPPGLLSGLAISLALAACTSAPTREVLDIPSSVPAAERHNEAGHADLGGPSESEVELSGFSETTRLSDGTTYRSSAAAVASFRVWLFRPGAWRIRLRYRTREASEAFVLALDEAPKLSLSPAAEWTEVQGLLEEEHLSRGANVLTIRRGSGSGGELDVDWIDLRPAGSAAARWHAPEPIPVVARQDANSEWDFYGEVPEGSTRAELRFAATAEGAAQMLYVAAEGEAWPQPASVSKRLEPGQPTGDLTLPLPGKGPFRLRLTTVCPTGEEAAAVRWSHARVVSWGDDTTVRQASLNPSTPVIPAPRDVFVFILDAGRADHFGAYGYPRLTSPWVDALSRDGYLFELARAQAPYTQASTATLMTGLEPETHDVRAVQARLSERAVTLAEVLSAAGYATCAFIGNANADRPFGFAQGFETFLGGRHDRTLARIEELLRTRDHNFFYVHLFPPHHPYFPPPPFAGVYSQETPGQVNGSSEDLIRIRRSGQGLPASELARLVAQYDENLLYGDHLIGDILGVANRLSRLDEALVIVLADHGEAFLEHGGLMHGYTVHEEEIRIPMILKLPRSARLGGRLVPELAGTEDILPTILDLCRVPDTAPLRHGRSLVPLLLGTGPGNAESYARAQGAQFTASLTQRRWKILRLENGLELYDLASDPGERRDLASERPFLAGLLGQRVRERTVRNLVDGQSAGLTERSVLDEETLRQLRALGYIE
jgi:arylsulfatase A-like enzyme